MKRTILIAMTLALTGMGFATSADAGWRANHPRRAEVNGRLNNQARRINTERREGEITGARRATCMPRIAASAARSAMTPARTAAISHGPKSPS